MAALVRRLGSGALELELLSRLQSRVETAAETERERERAGAGERANRASDGVP